MKRKHNSAGKKPYLGVGLLAVQEVRRRRNGPQDDPTVPIDRVRGISPGNPRPVQPPPPSYRPEPAYSEESYGQGGYREEPPRQAPPPQGKPSSGSPSRRVPLWAWFAGAAVIFFAAVAILLSLLLFGKPGFTVLVRGAVAGSDVFVDNIRRGVPAVDGTIRIADLKAGNRLIRVSHEGYVDFSTSVVGRDGEVKPVIVQLTKGKETTQSEIDYNGLMIFIPAGEYIMGADNQQPNERPAHKVNLPDYYIDKFEVSNSRYKTFCDQTGRSYPTNPHWDDGYFNKNPDSPVVGVNWSDAQAFAKWAGKRLPTEEEWEKAASWDPAGGKKHQWPWGDMPDASRVLLGSMRPSPSGAQPGGASGYGVQDMAGNVAEWVESYYQPYPGNPTPDEQYGTKNRVVRGGHFRNDIQDVRTTARYYSEEQFTPVELIQRSWLIGFRCAVSGDDPKLQEFLHSAGK